MNRNMMRGRGGMHAGLRYVVGAAFGAAVASVLPLVSCGSVARGAPFDPALPVFPSVKGENLNKRAFDVPSTLDARYNVLMVAFLREQQADVDTWLPAVTEITRLHADVEYYEVPTISPGLALPQLWLDDAMRAGIPDVGARERTITLYTDTAKFRSLAGIDGSERIWVGVVDRSGKVYWSARGSATEELASALRRAVDMLPR